LRSLGFEGDALLGEVEAAIETLRGLLQYSDLLGESVVTSLRLTLAQVSSRLKRSELAVVVAGEKGAGKRTFLDALVGDRQLGMALRRTRITTSLRRRATPRYRARLVGGKMEDFARLVPDRQKQMDERLVGTEAKFAEAESAHASLALKAASATQAREQAEAELEGAASELASALEISSSYDASLSSTEMAKDRSVQNFAAIERVMPRALVVDKPPVTFWARLWLAILRFLFRARWHAYLDGKSQRDQSTERLEALRERASAARSACVEAETHVAPLRAVVEAARGEEDVATREAAKAKAILDKHAAELAAQRAALGRYVEERLARFFAELGRLSDGSRDHEVLELAIDYPMKLLPDDVAIIDAPGAADDDADPAWNLVREEADGCILVSELDRGVSGPTARFLNRIREIVPHLLLVLTKMDAAFVDAMRRGSKDPAADVEQARRIGTRRFARQIGRGPDDVLSLAVSAQAALEDPESNLGQRFEGEIAKLFRLLRHERALILGTRAAAAVRRCIAETKEAEERAAQAYHERIEALEAGKVPDPEEFHRQKMADSEPLIADAVTRAIAHASGIAEARFLELRQREAENIRHHVWRRSLGELVGKDKSTHEQIVEIESDMRLAMEQSAEASVAEIELSIFEELGQRYRLNRPVRGSRASFHLLDIEVLKPPAVITTLAVTVSNHKRARLALSAGGLLVGAVVGGFLLSWLGFLVGVLFGGTLGLVRTRGSLERHAIARFGATVEQERQRVLAELAALEPSARLAIGKALDRSIEDAIVRFGRDIAEPIEANQKAMAKERSNLGRLRELEEALTAHDARLLSLMTNATNASSGLCR
jgi:hypothetical protein